MFETLIALLCSLKTKGFFFSGTYVMTYDDRMNKYPRMDDGKVWRRGRPNPFFGRVTRIVKFHSREIEWKPEDGHTLGPLWPNKKGEPQGEFVTPLVRRHKVKGTYYLWCDKKYMDVEYGMLLLDGKIMPQEEVDLFERYLELPKPNKPDVPWPIKAESITRLAAEKQVWQRS